MPCSVSFFLAISKPSAIPHSSAPRVSVFFPIVEGLIFPVMIYASVIRGSRKIELMIIYLQRKKRYVCGKMISSIRPNLNSTSRAL